MSYDSITVKKNSTNILMIDNNNELVFGLFFGVIMFFIGYKLLDNSDTYLKYSTLNIILIAFFIILFFIFGHLLNNIFQTFRTAKKKDN